MRIKNKLYQFFRSLFPLLFGIFAFSLPYFIGSPLLTDEIEVKRVIDGDTIELSDDTVVRLIGVDTPESVHPDADRNTEYGEIASLWMSEKLSGRFVRLGYDIATTDKYGRTLAYVYLDGEMLEDMLLEEGYAREMTVFPNIKYSLRFKLRENEAREKGSGFWESYFKE